MIKIVKKFGCLLLIFSIALQFSADRVLAYSRKIILKVKQVTKTNSKTRVKVTVNNNTNKDISVGAGYTLQKNMEINGRR